MLHTSNKNLAADIYPFLSGGGEMGSLMRSHDWSSSLAGTPDTWPQSLRTTLSILLNSRFPMFLFWGPDLVCFYNDAYRPSLGNGGKHPAMLGSRAEDHWQEIWPVIKPLIDQVLGGGGATWNEDQLIPIYRNGTMEDVYWTFSYSPVHDESGKPAGVFITCNETTEQVGNRKKMQEHIDQLAFAIAAAELGTWDYDPATNTFTCNDRLREWFGLGPGAAIELQHALDVIADKDRQRVADSIAEALDHRSGGYYDMVYTIIQPQTRKEIIVQAKGRARFNADKIAYRFNGTMEEVTEQVTASRKIEETDKRFRNTVQQAPVGITILRGRDFVVEMANDAYLRLVDKPEAVFVNRPLFDSLPEVKEIVHPLLDEVMDTGIPFNGIEYPVPIHRYGKTELCYFNFLYHPLQEDGAITGIIVIVTDVTGSVKARHNIAESEKQFRNMVMDSPIPMTIFRGREYIIEIANSIMFRNIWRKQEAEVLGKKVLDVFPELHDQKYPELLDKVFNTGEIHKETESPVYVQGDDGVKNFYLDFEYAPLFEPDGTVSGILVTVNDVTEKVEARIKLEESEKKLNMVIDASGLGTWELNLKTRAVTYSDRYLEILGFEKGAVPQHEELVSRIHPDDLPARERSFDTAFETGTLNNEFRIIWDDGSVHWIEARGKVFYDEQGRPAKMIGTVRDITENQARAENMARMAAIVQSSSDAIISKDLNGIITSWNPAAEQIFGYAEKEMIGESLIKLIPPDRVGEEARILLQLKNGERVNHFETKRITKDKEVLDVSLTISPIRGIHGNVIGASKIARNITPQKEAERMIAANEQKFKMLADSMPQLVWTGDTEGNLNYFNQAVYRYSGLTPEQVGKEGWLQIVHPEDRDANTEAWLNAVRTGTDFIVEHRFKRHDGEYRWQLSRAVPQKDAAGNVQMWVGTSTDIQDMKEQDQQKDFFISMASHELKTPITSIKGYVQLLQSAYRDKGDTLLTKSLAVIDRQIITLTSLISDLLDVSKIKAGSLVLNQQDFELSAMITEVIAQIQHVNPGYSIVYTSVPARVHADRERIGQVLINFLTNAVKYSPHSKEIIVTSRIEEDEVVVAVHDKGIGIHKADHERIFERFYRVEGKDETTYPGFGIGLFISSEIIRRHQGKIGLNSEPGKGSVFYFSITRKK